MKFSFATALADVVQIRLDFETLDLSPELTDDAAGTPGKSRFRALADGVADLAIKRFVQPATATV